MKKNRLPSLLGHTPLVRDAEQLIGLTFELKAAGSRIEINFWEQKLTLMMNRLLRVGNEEALNAAYDYLYDSQQEACDCFAELAETCAESGVLHKEDIAYDVLLFALPILSWSRYTIPTGTISPQILASLRLQLQTHVFTTETQLALADFLFSPDQLPQNLTQTYRLASQLWTAALDSKDYPINAKDQIDTMHLISDSRYILGAIAVPQGIPPFRWQIQTGNEASSTPGDRNNLNTTWQVQTHATLLPMFTGCVIETHLPGAYHAACHLSNQLSRPYALRSAVSFLEMTLSTRPDQLRVIIAPFYDRELIEYRISFALNHSPSVLHGVVWALLDDEDESTDSITQIKKILHEINIIHIKVLEQRLPIEYCDDCGVPLFATAEGEIVHAEIPGEGNSQALSLH